MSNNYLTAASPRFSSMSIGKKRIQLPVAGRRRRHPPERTPPPEQAFLVGVDYGGPNGAAGPRLLSAQESIEELARLSETAGLTVSGQTIQHLRQGVHPASFIGTGKIEEVRQIREELQAGVVIFDEGLSPAQQRNLERGLCCKVIDRSQLILDIFAQRARSQAGKLQVELAQLEYLRPRLTRQWTHLSRLGGGVGTRGPGESQLEVDRRRIRERIATLRRKLREVERTRALHRQERRRVPFPCVALVGYTNAGKSTLMNRLTQAEVFVEDKLFATLDPTSRRLDLPNGQAVLLIDTVGLINKLPHQLVDAFKGTLEEIRTADVLLHVIDATHPRWSEHQRIAEGVLEDMGVGNKPTITAFNKIDGLTQTADGKAQWDAECDADDWWGAPSASTMNGRDYDRDRVLHLSAKHGIGIAPLVEEIARLCSLDQEVIEVEVPLGSGELMAWLRRSGTVIEETYTETGVQVAMRVSAKVAGQLKKRLAQADLSAKA